jgi:hypothetical protein
VTPGVLYLHVGTHKTGTSSFQDYLASQSAALLAEGKRVYPEKNAYRLANLFIRRSLVTSPRHQYDPRKPDLRCAAPSLDDFEAGVAAFARHGNLPDDLVISSEEFCLLREPCELYALKQGMAGLFARIVPVIVLRQMAQWRESRQDQLHKTGLLQAMQSLPDAQSTNGSWYYDHSAIVDFWSRVGKPVVINYEAALASEASVIPALCRAIGHVALATEQPWLNRRSGGRV